LVALKVQLKICILVFDMLRKIVVFSLLLFPILGASQSAHQDSLYRLLLDKQHDSTRAGLLNEIAVSFQDENDYVAIKEANRALTYALKSKNRSQECLSLYHIGASYTNTNRFSDALKYYFKSLKVAEEINSEKMILQNFNQIGIIYSYQKNSKQAYKYFRKFLDLALKGDNKSNIARGYNNIGISLKNEGELEEAILNYKNALNLFKELEFNRGMISCLSNIGVGMMELNKLDSAAYYYQLASEIAISEKDTFSMAITYINVGELYLKQDKLQKAIENYSIAVDLSQKLRMLQQLRDANEGMYKCYEKLGNYEKAFIYHRDYMILRDSITMDEANGKLNLAEQNYEELKLEKLREQREQENKIEKAEGRRLLAEEKALNEEKNKYVLVLILVSVSIMILVVVLLFRYKEKNKSNKVLKDQRDEIAHSKKEITDSINYALRIQQAVLPDKELLGKYFTEHFILYQPKDIVSGDFYWFNEYEGKLILAAADCTGHGVPGGFMSMIGTDKLNHAVFEKGETNPSEILSIISQGVKKALKQDDSENASRDGMDMSICSFQISELNSTNAINLKWSGANRPLWIITGNEAIEIKPTKTAVGGFTSDEVIFDSHTIEVKKGTSLYLFSDGYADQFGGTEQKKMTTRKFREKLIAIQNLTMKEQEKELSNFFRSWRGSSEQIDDVLIVGLKL
jgi:serine phosphatase RsbU (regulator of sigma subunit)